MKWFVQHTLNTGYRVIWSRLNTLLTSWRWFGLNSGFFMTGCYTVCSCIHKYIITSWLHNICNVWYCTVSNLHLLNLTNNPDIYFWWLDKVVIPSKLLYSLPHTLFLYEKQLIPRSKVKVEVLHPIQQPGLYWDKSSTLLLDRSWTHTKMTACD